jgi:RNA polymerase sigma-70 factor (ECF subfamily)
MNSSLTDPGCWVSVEVTTDRELAAAVGRKDRRALERLYQMYFSRLACVLRRLLLSDETIDDVIIETFLTVWTSAEDLEKETKISTWIMGIACRLAIQTLRYAPARVIDPNDPLSAALLRLPLEQRLALMLAYQMGFSIDEISQATESPHALVRTRIALARTNLRACGFCNSP